MIIAIPSFTFLDIFGLFISSISMVKHTTAMQIMYMDQTYNDHANLYENDKSLNRSIFALMPSSLKN